MAIGVGVVHRHAVEQEPALVIAEGGVVVGRDGRARLLDGRRRLHQREGEIPERLGELLAATRVALPGPIEQELHRVGAIERRHGERGGDAAEARGCGR